MAQSVESIRNRGLDWIAVRCTFGGFCQIIYFSKVRAQWLGPGWLEQSQDGDESGRLHLPGIGHRLSRSQ